MYSPKDIRASSNRVYVVDDDQATREALDSMLRSVGYSVELFESGTQLLARAQNGLAGCIVLDIRLPGPSGLEIQRRLNEEGINVPIIFITGHGDITMAVQAMKANAMEFLAKPFREQELLDAISAAMDAVDLMNTQKQSREKLTSLVETLSEREEQILLMLRQGMMGKQISHNLNLSEGTVKVHKRNILRKLQVPNINQAIAQFGDVIGA